LQAFPVLLGDTDFRGNVSATIIHQFGQRLRCKAQAQVAKGELSVAQTTAEWRGRVSTSALTFANIDLVGDSGVVVAQVGDVDLNANLCAVSSPIDATT
jgi:hypothetical protein